MTKVVICVAVALVAVSVMRILDRETATPAAGSAISATASDGGPTGRCGTVATHSCTPDLGGRGTVTVEGLTWHVERMSTASVLGQTSFATGIRARGTYVIATLRVDSERQRPATLSSELVELVGARTYLLDASATSLNAGEAENVIHGAQIAPGQRLELSVVFDVPSSAITKRLGLRFNASATGSVHALIRPWGRMARVLKRRSASTPANGGW